MLDRGLLLRKRVDPGRPTSVVLEMSEPRAAPETSLVQAGMPD